MDDDAIAKFIEEIKKKNRSKQHKGRHRYVEDIIRFLRPHKRSGLSRRAVLDGLERQRRADGLPVPDNFDETVQSAYNQWCVDSAVFRRRTLPDSEAPFFSPGGSGSGMWAAHPERAAHWLRKHGRDGDV